MFGAIEAGGTKFVCAVGTGPENLQTLQVATTTPVETMRACLAFLKPHAPEAVGIASFGPVDLKRGRITSTPKPGWSNFAIAEEVAKALGVPVGFDTDVNGAVLGEARWGAARGIRDVIYLTVGTGIGGGALSGGCLLHGRATPEMGHIRIPHDRAVDPFAGACPFHGDCLEGLASGPAMETRWGIAAPALPPHHPAWELEAHYLGLGLASLFYTLSPRLIILGGGVMHQEQLFPAVRQQFQQAVNGYLEPCDVTPPGLGDRSGVLGAIVLAEQVLALRPNNLATQSRFSSY